VFKFRAFLSIRSRLNDGWGGKAPWALASVRHCQTSTSTGRLGLCLGSWHHGSPRDPVLPRLAISPAGRSTSNACSPLKSREGCARILNWNACTVCGPECYGLAASAADQTRPWTEKWFGRPEFRQSANRKSGLVWRHDRGSCWDLLWWGEKETAASLGRRRGSSLWAMQVAQCTVQEELGIPRWLESDGERRMGLTCRITSRWLSHASPHRMVLVCIHGWCTR
jgi:hypothetical protein